MKSLRTLLIVPLVVLMVVGALPALAAPVQRVQSPGGIEAWLIEDHSLPIIVVDFGFRDGATRDPQGKEGLANMVSGLLDEGAGDLDSLAFRTKLENLAISLSFSARQDVFGGALRTVSENRDAAFEMLRLSLLHPRFDAEPVERIRAQILTGLKMREKDPETIAQRRLNERLFSGHPYARPVEGTETSVKALTVEDLRGFVAGLGKDQLKIGVAGDISPEELGRRLDDVFGALPAQGSTVEVADVVPRAHGLDVVALDIPQSVALFTQKGMDRNDPDFYPAFVVNYILGGGGFSSRLMDEVREKRGLAYGVSTSLYQLDHAPLLSGAVATANNRMAESLQLIRTEWARMANEGPTAEELENAKTYLIGAWPLRFVTTTNVASILMSMQMDDYPIDHLETRNDKVRAVTLDQARKAAKRLLDPQALSVVVVGKPQGLGESPSSNP